MKHRRNTAIQLMILAVLGGAAMITLLLPRLPVKRSSAPVEVSVILREADSSLWSNARLGMDQAAGELGAELRLLTLAGANDGADQVDILRREVEQGADVLVIIPADSEGLAQALAERGTGCPILSMESPLEGAGLTVAPDNEALGRELAQAVLEDGPGPVILLLNASPNSAGVSARVESARETLENAGVEVRHELVGLSGTGDRLSALLRQPDLSAVMVFEPALTERAAALKENLGAETPLYGVGVTANGAAWLERGVISAVAAWSDFAGGYLAVEGAVSLAQGEKRPLEQLPFFIVRGEEIYEPEYQKLLFPVTG